VNRAVIVATVAIVVPVVTAVAVIASVAPVADAAVSLTMMEIRGVLVRRPDGRHERA
jgi:hypothetical protein